jgi:penicillin amidase
VRHLLQLPALSALDLSVQGGPSTLSPSSGSGTHGASWRMVVELGPEVRAMAIYPGGQSGDPVSPQYKDRLPRWVAGALDSLFVPRTAAELDGTRRAATLTLVPAR